MWAVTSLGQQHDFSQKIAPPAIGSDPNDAVARFGIRSTPMTFWLDVLANLLIYERPTRLLNTAPQDKVSRN